MMLEAVMFRRPCCATALSAPCAAVFDVAGPMEAGEDRLPLFGALGRPRRVEDLTSASEESRV